MLGKAAHRGVRFATTVARGHATLAPKRTLLLGWAGLSPVGSHQLCGWRTHSITSSACSRIAVGMSRPRRKVDQHYLCIFVNRVCAVIRNAGCYNALCFFRCGLGSIIGRNLRNLRARLKKREMAVV